MPLADKYRPQTLSDIVGQKRLVGPNGVLTRMANTGDIKSMILYGPPGTGKSTSALILADASGMPLHKLNGVSASVKDIKDIVAKADGPVLLYLDEIQYFNKKQQQSLLPYIEDGSITLIASTTENPYHDVYDAILSRCIVLEFKRVRPEDMRPRLRLIANDIQRSSDFPDETLLFIANISSGDMRRAINTLELMAGQVPIGTTVTTQTVTDLLPAASMAGFDMDGDNHYGYISALQKSIRGSDPDAAVFWLAKLLEGGDIISPSRRLLVIACEDIGLAWPDAITHTLSCVRAAEMLGLPEAYKPLTQAVVALALAPKSNTNEPAWMAAQEDIRAGLGATVPRHLSTACAPGYIYPHEYPNHWVDQQYLPDDLVGRVYYRPGDNPTEQEMYGHWQQVRDAAKR